MPLRLTLKPNERLILNGCVLRNGPRRLDIEIENRADVLRGAEMLDAQSAQTPVRRLAYQIQIALVSEEHRSAYSAQICADIKALRIALPRFETVWPEIEGHVRDAEFYRAFRALAPIIAHEDALFGAQRTTAA